MTCFTGCIKNLVDFGVYNWISVCQADFIDGQIWILPADSTEGTGYSVLLDWVVYYAGQTLSEHLFICFYLREYCRFIFGWKEYRFWC